MTASVGQSYQLDVFACDLLNAIAIDLISRSQDHHVISRSQKGEWSPIAKTLSRYAAQYLERNRGRYRHGWGAHDSNTW